MFDRTDIVYRYDGTFDGFMSCVFESFLRRERPSHVQLYDAEQETLYPVHEIETNPSHADRVKKSLQKRISREAESLINQVFLSCDARKDFYLMDFLHLGFQVGAKVTRLSTHNIVDPVLKLALRVGNEAHYSLEFLRFSQYGSYLAAVITPKNSILPMIVGHFSDRFPEERFVIYDKAHRMAFMHENSAHFQFIYDTDIMFPAPDEAEKNYRRLWRHFYETIAVEGRVNPKLRMNLMPKRYWPNMTEFQEECNDGVTIGTPPALLAKCEEA